MKKLFEPVVVGGVSLRNRLIRSATLEYAFNNNTEEFAFRLMPIYEKLAGNGVAAIITGAVGVDENARANQATVKAYGETFIPEMAKLTKRVHELGAKLVVQINHSGIKAGQIDGGGLSLGPSASEDKRWKAAKEMTRDDIHSAVVSFARAALRCKEAAADAVQIHAAHGCLLSEFLNPYFNKRTDEYGGPIENRARIVFKIYDAVRAAVGEDYPIWIKINCNDLTEPSISPAEFQWVCVELDRRGIDAIEVSGGAAIDAKSGAAQVVKTEKQEGVFAKEAIQLAGALSTSIVSVCGYRTPGMIEKWLNSGRIQAISLCRPLISEPDIVGRWEAGDHTRSRCISCNQCFNPELLCKPFVG